MTKRILQVALVGCGQIADAHLQEIRKIPSARIVGVCDQNLDLAQQAAARFEVPAAFADLGRMLSSLRPDVLHVTTPPQTHGPIACQALAAGTHVYLEKPFTVDVGEADEVLRLAEASGRLVCVGHDQLFDPVWEECRQRYQRGEFGQIVHVDSVQGYDLAGPFGRALTSDRGHWVHRLPGGLFQNIISHALYRITEFLPDEQPRLWATWFGSAAAQDFPSELRVMLRGVEVTANLLFLSKARPAQRVVRLYGTRQCVEVDFDGRVLRVSAPITLPGPFARMQVPFRHLREAASSLRTNLWRFLRCDLHYFAGMRRLFEQFYQAIGQGTAPPIPYGEIRRVTAIMDDIFAICRAEADSREATGQQGNAGGRCGTPVPAGYGR